MDSEIEKYVIKQSKLEKQIEKLFAENKMLHNRIGVLYECLSIDKIKQKISDLENKEKILKSLEGMVSDMKTEIKPLDYLKQLLQRHPLISTVSTTNNDDNNDELKCSEISQLSTHSECAIETLDSLSDVSSEGSVMVLSEYDVVSDEDVPDDIERIEEKTTTNKVMYDVALQMASSIHSIPLESPIPCIEPIGPFPNINNQEEDLPSNTNDSGELMNTSSKIEQLLKMYDIVDKRDLINCTENAKKKLGIDKGKIESIIHDVCKLSFCDEILDDTLVVNADMIPSQNNKLDNLSISVNDSWVKVDTDELFNTSMEKKQLKNILHTTTGSQKENSIPKEDFDELIDTSMPNEQLNNIFQPTTGSQQKNSITKVNLDVKIQMQSDHQFQSKGCSEITNIENVCNDVDINLKNEVNNTFYSANILRDEGLVKTLLLNTKCSSVPRDCTKAKVNVEVDQERKNDQLLSNYSIELKENSEVKHFMNVNSHNLDHNYKTDIHNPVCSTIILKDKTEIESSFSINHDWSELKENSEVKMHVQDDLSCSDLTELKESCRVNNIENVVCNDVDDNIKNEVYNPVGLVNNLKDEDVIKSSLINTKCSSILRECNEPKVNIEVDIHDMLNNQSCNLFESDKMPMQLCCSDEFNNLGLNFQLSNGIHQHGFHRLMTLQQQCISHCINGRDIVLHSYPCAGKSIMCLISVLQRINTSFNECQAIILVPTLELALFTQKIVKSLGIFLNVSTCIGGTNVPRKVSPVPHVVISTPQGLCDMIDCNSLCKDYIKMLVIDDADEMIKSNGFFNKIRHIILFLKNDRQLIILSTSKLEEILDQFSDTMQNPEYIILPDEKPSLDDIEQYYVNVPDEWKFDALCELYNLLNLRRTVVYCNTWHKTSETAESLRLKTCTVSAVHNEMDTSQRRLILRQFRSDISRVLVTTGLLKGEDFSEVIWVINYDLPKSPEDYIRRIIGCFNRRIKVINFVTPNNKTTKENIEIAFNMHMLCLPQDLTDMTYI